MYYFSTKSRKHLIHIAGCHHVAGIQKGNLGSFTNLKDAYREGYQMCQCCNDEISKLIDRLEHYEGKTLNMKKA